MPFRPTAPLLKKASKSSTLWLARQYKDPYVRARLSNPVNYRSRSAFKLLEVESRFGFLDDFLKEAKRSVKSKTSKRANTRTFNVVDLGAAPGGWSQVIAAKLGLAGDELEEPLSHRKTEQTSNMAEWKEEMSKRKKMSGMFDELVDEEILEMENLVKNKTGDGWSTPPTSKSKKKKFGLNKDVEGADFGGMDPLDYLNSRDLDQPSSTTSAQQPPPLPINLIALDILPMTPLAGVHTLQMNFLSPDAPDAVTSLLAKLNAGHTGKASLLTPPRVDLMLSDLSPPHTGNRTADVSHSVTLLRAVWDFARKTLKTRYEYHLERVRQAQWTRQDVERERGLTGTGQDIELDVATDIHGELEHEKEPQRRKSILKNGGVLVIKHFAHPISTSFCRVFLNPYFSKILYFKPPASRSDSSEGYWVCMGWRGVPDEVTMELLEEKMEKDVEVEMTKESQRERDERKEEVKQDVEDPMDNDAATQIALPEGKALPGLLETHTTTSASGRYAPMTLANVSAPSGTPADCTPPAQTLLVLDEEVSTKSVLTAMDPLTAPPSAQVGERTPEAGSDTESAHVSIDWHPKPRGARPPKRSKKHKSREISTGDAAFNEEQPIQGQNTTLSSARELV
ncbi:FtsJ-like methyltransferase-domain-containing protein [Cytidiella melzeri]|nr:FtsJ-like methyltransferase-domain-containing protein [Cytidiella melzeri]